VQASCGLLGALVSHAAGDLFYCKSTKLYVVLRSGADRCHVSVAGYACGFMHADHSEWSALDLAALFRGMFSVALLLSRAWAPRWSKGSRSV
jgi:hypothetical protein